MSTNPSDTQTLKGLVAAGCYDFVIGAVNEKNFGPDKLKIEADPKTFAFSRWVDKDDVIEAMEAESYRPAMIADGLLYGAKNPSEQFKSPIIILDAIVMIDDIWPASVVLTRLDSMRMVLLMWRNDSHPPGTRFLGVRR